MYANKYHGWKWHAWGAVQGLAGILDGIVMALSFGFLGLGLQLTISRYRAKASIEAMKARAQKDANK